MTVDIKYLFHRRVVICFVFQDIYILAALVFLTLQSSESSIMCALSKVLHIGEVVVWDQCIMASLAVILVAFHVIFGFYIYSTVSTLVITHLLTTYINKELNNLWKYLVQANKIRDQLLQFNS